MAASTANTAVAIAIQAVADTFTTPIQPADLMPVSQLSLRIDGITIANDEYTGSSMRNGDAVAGKRVTLSYRIKMRAPGGASPPAANAFLLGRVLQAAKMTELLTTAAIPAAPEALGAGSTTTSATLGITAAATADLYKALPLLLSSKGATFKQQLTAIRSYSAAKAAALPETLGAVPTGNYQIPKSVAYLRSNSSADPVQLSQSVWLGGNRYDLKNCALTQCQFVVPVSAQQAQYPEIQVTYDCTISAYTNEAAPAVASLGAIPLFKDGEQHLAMFEIGGQTFTVDLGITGEAPPNPNKPDGTDPSQLVGSTARLSVRRQQYAKNVFDSMALADAQSQHPFYAMWGTGSGTIVQVLVPDARFNYPSPDLGGNFVMEDGELLIDALDRSVAIIFPYS